MSYELISETKPKARKEYSCIWCPEKIEAGAEHVHEVSKYDGELQDHRWHPECRAAATVYFRESGEEEFSPHECKRGTTEEA
jgi:hypothetical protein